MHKVLDISWFCITRFSSCVTALNHPTLNGPNNGYENNTQQNILPVLRFLSRRGSFWYYAIIRIAVTVFGVVGRQAISEAALCVGGLLFRKRALVSEVVAADVFGLQTFPIAAAVVFACN